MGEKMKYVKLVTGIMLILALTIFFTGCESSPSEPSDATLVVVNNSSDDIYYLYVALSSSSSWGNNQLSSTLYSGYSYTLNGIPAGEYDLLADASGITWEYLGALLNEGATWTWTLID